MKRTSRMRIGVALCALALTFGAAAQTDSTKNEKADTIRVGGMIIIRKSDGSASDKKNDVVVVNRSRRHSGPISTNWWIVDLGFANFRDQTNYGSPEAAAFAPGLNKGNLDLRTGKSVNVNIWVFMQKLKLIQEVVSLKYGLGLELNNYRFNDERILLEENPTRLVIDQDLNGVRKNKLAADYVTVPLMLNFNLTPNRNKKGFGFAAGVSGGYLYSARQKFKDDGRVSKNHDNYDLRKFKVSYIGELSLGPVKLYGSYATRSMWERGLDQTPYNLGIRLSYF